MNGIINIDKKVLENILLSIDNIMNPFYKGETTTYSHIIEHPTDGRYALIIDLKDIELMIETYPNELEDIGVSLISQVVELSSDWRVEVELDLM